MQSNGTTIIIIRHGEKLEWPGGLAPPPSVKMSYQDNHLLSVKGYERAHALAGYFIHRKEMVELYQQRPLTTIISQDNDTSPTGKGKSIRPRETIWPLLNQDPANYVHTESDTHRMQKLISFPLQFARYTKSKYLIMIQRLKTDFANQTVIVSWNHKEIVQILRDLGLPNSQLIRKWPGDRYDITLVVDLGKSSVMMKQHPQCLLYGDSNTIID